MHWLLFIHKILFFSTYFEPQVLIFRRIQLYTCSLWYCNSQWELLVACRYTAWVRTDWQSVLTQAVYQQATSNSPREWQYHMLHVYNCILLKMSTWGTKHVKENNILWVNNNQCIKLVINIESVHDARSEKYQVKLYQVFSNQTYIHISHISLYIPIVPPTWSSLVWPS